MLVDQLMLTPWLSRRSMRCLPHLSVASLPLPPPLRHRAPHLNTAIRRLTALTSFRQSFCPLSTSTLLTMRSLSQGRRSSLSAARTVLSASACRRLASSSASASSGRSAGANKGPAADAADSHNGQSQPPRGDSGRTGAGTHAEAKGQAGASGGDGAGGSAGGSNDTDGSSGGGDGDHTSSTPPPPPPSGRYAVLGGAVVLGVLAGAGWLVYERGWVSEYMAASLLSELASGGPSSVVDLNGPGDKWQLIHVNATLRRKCAEPAYFERLIEGIAPAEHIVEVQRMCLVILSELAHDRQQRSTTAQSMEQVLSGWPHRAWRLRTGADTTTGLAMCSSLSMLVQPRPFPS